MLPGRPLFRRPGKALAADQAPAYPAEPSPAAPDEIYTKPGPLSWSRRAHYPSASENRARASRSLVLAGRQIVASQP